MKWQIVCLLPYSPDADEICIDFPNDGKALYDYSLAGVTEYEWDALDWTITQHPNDPFPAVDMQDVQITAPYGAYVGDPVYFTIRAKDSCDWGDWKYPKLELEAVNCGMMMMTMSPNPADTYVTLSFEDETEIGMLSVETIDRNKIQVKKPKKSKKGEVGEYLIQILDKEGVIRKSVKSSAKRHTVEVNDLKPGTYFLHLTCNKEIYKQQLIIR